MARSLKNKPNVLAPDGDYIYGRILDDTGNEDGTPVNEEVYGDMHQFFEKLLDEAGIIANEFPEQEYVAFQYFDALQIVAAAVAAGLINTVNPSGLITKVLNIGNWDMSAATGTDEADVALGGIAITKIRSIKAVIRDDADTSYYDFFTASASPGGLILKAEGTNIRLICAQGPGFFDSTLFNSTPYNRGWVVIQYIP